MNAPTPDLIEARKWCIERAFERCDDIEVWPYIAADLIRLIETGQPPERETVTADVEPIMATIIEPATSEAEPATAGEPEHPITPRLVPRMVVAEPPPDLTDREQDLLDAIIRLNADGDFPLHGAMSEASGVPRGSLGYLLERLKDKGYLARPDGRWVVARGLDGEAAA